MLNNIRKLCFYSIGISIVTVILSLELQARQLYKNIEVEKDKAKLIEFGSDVSEVFIANPQIADVKLNKPSGAYVYGKKAGSTTLFISTSDGTSTEVNINVNQSLSHLNRVLDKVFPEEQITASSLPNGIMLTGEASSAKVSADIEALVRQFITKREMVVNNLTVASPQQVYLKVKIAEVKRNVLNRFNPNWSFFSNGLNDHFSYGILTGRNPLALPAPVVPALPIVNGNFARGNGLTPPPFGSAGFRFTDGVSDFSSLFDILDKEGLGTVLAEPNLVALSGESASFLVGGEFPYPVPQNNQNITIEFKMFGISLAFTPTVLQSNMINLRIRPEVSELDNANPLNFPVGGAIVPIPAIKTRKAETSIEIGSGQSMVIGGLLSSKIASNIKSLPGLESIPIIGALFRSSEFQREETELVIMVTPYLVTATKPSNLSTPVDGIEFAPVLDMLLRKKLNTVAEATSSEVHSGGLTTEAGFHID